MAKFAELSFVITHYAGEVLYTAENWLVEVFQKSTRIIDALKKSTLDDKIFYLTMVTAGDITAEEYRKKTKALF